MTVLRYPRQQSPAYLAWIRTLSCVVCGNPHVEAAHIRFGDLRAAKRQTGMGEKPNDEWTIPLCSKHHREQHQTNERAWWHQWCIDPIFIALALWRVAGDADAAQTILNNARRQ